MGFNPPTDDPAGDYSADHPLLLPGVCASLPVFYPCPSHAGANCRDRDPHSDIHARSADADAGGDADPMVAADLYPHPHVHIDPDTHAHPNADDDTNAHLHADTDGHADADGHADKYSYLHADGDRYPYPYADSDTHRDADGDTGVPHAAAAHPVAGAHRHNLANGKPDLDTRSHLNTCGTYASATRPPRVLKRLPLRTAQPLPVVRLPDKGVLHVLWKRSIC